MFCSWDLDERSAQEKPAHLPSRYLTHQVLCLSLPYYVAGLPLDGPHSGELLCVAKAWLWYSSMFIYSGGEPAHGLFYSQLPDLCVPHGAAKVTCLNMHGCRPSPQSVPAPTQRVPPPLQAWGRVLHMWALQLTS